jgi:hypothetical protein
MIKYTQLIKESRNTFMDAAIDMATKQDAHNIGFDDQYPYGEEVWEDEYDIIVEKPGLTLKHRKGGDAMACQYAFANNNIDQYWRYIIQQNPNSQAIRNSEDKKFYVGLFLGILITSSYYQNQDKME